VFSGGIFHRNVVLGRRIPVPTKSCWLWPATKEGSLLSKIWTKIDLFNLSPEQDLSMLSPPPSSAGASWPEGEGCRRGRDDTGRGGCVDGGSAGGCCIGDDNCNGGCRQQQTTNTNQQQARGKAMSGSGNDRGGVVAVVAASEAVAALAVAWHCGGGKRPIE